MGKLIAKMKEYTQEECGRFGLEYRPLKRNYEKIINYNFSTYNNDCFRLLREEIYWDSPRRFLRICNYKGIDGVMELRKAECEPCGAWFNITGYSCIDVSGKKSMGFVLGELEFVFAETLDGFAAFLGMLRKSILSEANPLLVEQRKVFEGLGTTYDEYVEKIIENCFKEIEKQLESEETEYKNLYRGKIEYLNESEKSTLLQVEDEEEE